jgi:hypothetical protein
MADELTGPGSPALECHAVSGVIIIGRGTPSDGVRALAAGLAADDEHVRVIVDLPADLRAGGPADLSANRDGQLAALAQDVLPVLAADPRTPRLIPSSRGLAATTGTGRLIADALGRAVLAHRGAVVATSRGGLFVPPAAGPGWVLLEPGQHGAYEHGAYEHGAYEHGPEEPVSCRFPAPRWMALAALDQPVTLSRATMAQPLPGGAWLREPRGDGSLSQIGQWLAANLAWADDQIYVVLGHPGAPAMLAADIASFWETLPERARGLVRFVPFGGTAPAGQELADLVRAPVVVMAGLPVAGRGRNAAVSVRVLGSDGRLGDAPPAAEVRAEPRVPAPASGPPAFALPSITLESGPADTTGPAAPVLAGSADLAELADLAHPAGGQDRPARGGTIRDDGQPAGTFTDKGVDGFSGAGGPVQVQPVPGPTATLAAPARGLAQERQWLHRTLAAEFDAAASAVTRVLSQAPGLRAPREQAADALADLVAAWLYLAGRGQRIDDAARTGQVGPHVPFGRCAAEGLRRLPSYRGPARLRVALGEAEWRWYGARTQVTEWAFCPALTDGTPLPGSVDFLIWSVTARRADLLAPGDGGQVIFLPGTRFRVLRVRAAQRREVLLRELAPGELGEDGQVDVIATFDDVAVAGLEKAAAAWLGAGAGPQLHGARARRFGSPPGLVVGDAEAAATAASGAVSGARA